MTRFFAMRTAMTAAVPCTVDNSCCANMFRAVSARAVVMHTALILDAMILASIFVALISLIGLLGLSLITLLGLLILGTTAHRLKVPRPVFV